MLEIGEYGLIPVDELKRVHCAVLTAGPQVATLVSLGLGPPARISLEGGRPAALKFAAIRANH
jgi:hypothetical protein